MENFDLTQRISSLSLFIMLISIVIVIFVCVLLYLYIKNTYPEGHQGLFAGMAAYFLICNVILVLIFGAMSTVAKQFQTEAMSEGLAKALINTGTVLSLLIQCFVLVHCVEFAYRRYVYQPGSSRFGDALMFALGYGLVETLQFVFTTFLNWFMGFNVNGVGLAALKESMEAEKWEAYLEEISFLFTNTPDTYVASLLERFLYLAFIFALISMVHFVASGKASKTFLINISTMYLFYCVPNLLKRWEIIENYWLLLLIYAVIVIIICLFAWQIVVKASPEDAERLKKTWNAGVIKTAFQRKKSKEKKSNIQSFRHLKDGGHGK